MATKDPPAAKYTVVRDGVVIDAKEYGRGDTVTLAAVDAQWLIRDGMVREAGR